MPDSSPTTARFSAVLTEACRFAAGRRDEFVTPEHLLWAMADKPRFLSPVQEETLRRVLRTYLEKYSPTAPEGEDYKGPECSNALNQVLDRAVAIAEDAQAEAADLPHVVKALLDVPDTYARTALVRLCGASRPDFMTRVVNAYDTPTVPRADNATQEASTTYARPLDDTLKECNPLIGRDAELQRAILVLCRRDKNNPLFVGEPGVGKTALVRGLAAKIAAGEVPERLKGCRIHVLDLTAVMAGAGMRGEMEERLKQTLDALEKSGRAILFIDDMHILAGTDRSDGTALDAAAILLPYMERGALRVIGATTYAEFNRSLSRKQALARRFEKIDVPEPSVAECALILKGLAPRYEAFHSLHYIPEALQYAAEAAEAKISGKFLPDKAIDLIDEAGAWRELHPDPQTAEQIVDKPLINRILAKMCGTVALAGDGADTLSTLEERMKEQIFGQDEAVRQVCEAVQMSAAGLSDPAKPMASLLFVGPTGVGKTEVARTLALQLGIPLLRFDMSEYAEKHTVAKLIGSPAGYVGYDDGGLLTDAVRKSPHCVLLFDELEKAHSDIYNILLQVMDYGTLTDSHGVKADFRHVIFIMTTNAGAQKASQGTTGFVQSTQAGQVMLKSVKATFKPEFLNRLTAVTIFSDISRAMASLILDKKLTQLRAMLASRHVELELSAEAREWLLEHGFSPVYGGREVERVIASQLKPLLMRAILFGPLAQEGTASVALRDGQLTITD